MLPNTEIRIETVSDCNSHCTICPREKMTRPIMTMGKLHFEYLVDQAVDLGAALVTPFGHGEPLLDPKIEDRIQYCTNYGLDTFITTNASLLTMDRAKALLDSGLGHIRFSCHGIGSDYNKVHRGLSWDETLSNIEMFLELNAACNFDSCVVSVSVIPMHDELVGDIRTFWESRPIDFLEIWRPHGWAGGRSYRSVETRKKSCGRPFNGPIQIMADGRFIACCFDFNGELVIGDTHTSSIDFILNGEPLRRLRSKHESGDLKGLLCERCDQLNIEDKSPLLYSSRDNTREVGKTSSAKTKLKEM
ncbi:MAG: hypothetical protein A2W01_11215 [Candidatus Solincola sediminis]|nr:MAG: hypothetical protein A2W01_11215 [Candidatus Solincola sediminis]